MNFYVTSEPARRLKNAFQNIKQYKIIDVDYIFESTGMDPNDNICGFIIDEEIQRMILEGINAKKYVGVIYVNSKLDEGLINKIRMVLGKLTEDESIVEITLLDDYDVPKQESLYKFVNNILFFPILKKPKVIKCKPIKFK